MFSKSTQSEKDFKCKSNLCEIYHVFLLSFVKLSARFTPLFSMSDLLTIMFYLGYKSAYFFVSFRATTRASFSFQNNGTSNWNSGE